MPSRENIKLMKTKEIQGTSILILGYGREGKSVEQWLLKEFPEVTITVADKTRDQEYLTHLDRYDTVIRSPGVSPFQHEIVEFIEKGGHMTTATNIFFSLVPGITIGVTGTKGKSTTASLIAHMLSSTIKDVRLVGNIGIPMLDHLFGATSDTTFVIELSSHQLCDIRYSPHIAVVLPIVPEHQDYYRDMETYARAKANIAAFQSPDDVLVFDVSNALLRSLFSGTKAKQIGYTTGSEVSAVAISSKDELMLHQKPLVSRSNLHIHGNTHSLLAAITVCDVLHLNSKCIKDALVSFVPLPHRLEFVGEFGDIRFYNDSLATIPEATVHALDALGDDVTTLIAGGFDRGLSYDVLGKRLAESHVRTLILFPDTGKKILASIPSGSSIPYYFVQTMEEAVRLAKTHTVKGKICLLSPASASFNLFRDYADRGDQFKAMVKKI
jgi:UDP-N-acetylmuramoylalanine--D-glutamate ligase